MIRLLDWLRLTPDFGLGLFMGLPLRFRFLLKSDLRCIDFFRLAVGIGRIRVEIGQLG